jgi:hypothetical protein
MLQNEKKSAKDFEEEMNRTVTVRVVSSRGHDEWKDMPEIALSRIQSEVNTTKKWLYIDGVQENANNLTVDRLLNAEYIILTNALVGG